MDYTRDSKTYKIIRNASIINDTWTTSIHCSASSCKHYIRPVLLGIY